MNITRIPGIYADMEMAAASAVCAIPALGMATGNLLMKSNKLAAAGKAVKAIAKMTQGVMGVCAGIEMAKTGFTNFLDGLEAGTFDAGALLQTLGGIGIAMLSGKGLASSGRELQACTRNSGKTMKGSLIDADISWELIEGEDLYYHSCKGRYADTIAKEGFRTDIPNEIKAFRNNRYGRGVYLADSPQTALAERPGGTILVVDADLGKNLDLTNRGIIGGIDGNKDYSVTHSIARGARKHGYDSITFCSAERRGGVNTVVMNPQRVKVKEIIR